MRSPARPVIAGTLPRDTQIDQAYQALVRTDRKYAYRAFTATLPDRVRPFKPVDLPDPLAHLFDQSPSVGVAGQLLTADPVSAKPVAGYVACVLKRWVATGLVDRTQVCVTSEMDLIRLSARGYAGDEARRALTRPGLQVWWIDGLGEAVDYNRQQRDEISTLLDYIAHRGGHLLISTTGRYTWWRTLFSTGTQARLLEAVNYALYHYDGTTLTALDPGTPQTGPQAETYPVSVPGYGAQEDAAIMATIAQRFT